MRWVAVLWFGSMVVAFAVAIPAPARACGIPLVYVSVVGAEDGEGQRVIPLGSDVLFENSCPTCGSIPESPVLEVFDADGQLVPGEASWIDRENRSGYVRWHPESSLAEGRYEVTWHAPPADVLDPLVFVVQGEPATDPALDFDVRFEPDRVGAGEGYTCHVSSCGPRAAFTQSVQRPVVVARPREPVAPGFVEFLYRPVRLDAEGERVAGAWRASHAAHGELRSVFEAVAGEYCVEIEAMRVSDGTVSSLGEHCVDDTLGANRPVPEPFADCNVTGSLLEPYRAAWCADNAEACDPAWNPDHEACDRYADVCADGTVDADTDAGGIDVAVEHDAGSAPDGAVSAVAERPREAQDVAAGSEAERAGGSCAVASGRADTALASLLLVALPVLALVRRKRTSHS